MRLALVLLSFNEIDGVRALLPSLVDVSALGVDEVFAVDGGSSDGTLEEYARRGVRVVQQRSRGRGEAMRLACVESSADALVFFSPDGNEDWHDIPKFRAHLEAGADLVIASRMMPGAHNEEDTGVFRPRKWANLAFNQAANTLFGRGLLGAGQRISDSINGFRAIRRDRFSALQIDAVGYTVEYQMTIRALQAGLRIVEFPTTEGARIGGETKAPSIPTGLRFVRCLAQEAARTARMRLTGHA